MFSGVMSSERADKNTGNVYILLLAVGPLYEPHFCFLIYKMGMITLNSWSCED